MNKTTCRVIFITHDKDYHIVTQELGIKPYRCFNKGDKFTIKHPSYTGSKAFGLWEIKSQSVDSEGEGPNVSYHIKYFKELLQNKIEVIDKLKNFYQFECVFKINIETEDAEEGFSLCQSELSFITRIASRYESYVLTFTHS